MSDKRISQLVERVSIANNDVLPIVALNAATTNKVTISTIQDWMQTHLDHGVTSIGITIGSTGTDISVTGSPVTAAGNITINVPTSSAANRGLLSAADWSTFNNKVGTARSISTTAPLQGGGDLSANRTLSITQAGVLGDGYLSSVDWNTFNNKQPALGYTPVNQTRQLTINGTSYDLSADRTWNVGTVTSIGVSMPSAFTVSGSPVTSSGTIAITGAGNSTQYIDGTGSLQTFPSIVGNATNLIREVYNNSGATMTKGTIIYINGGQGNLPTIAKALATGDSTSAQTYGVVREDIGNMSNGYIIVVGDLMDMPTNGFAVGTQLYLSGTTAGTYTSTKPYAPIHLVYVGIVTRSHPTQGVIAIKIQNGYEMDELHNVAAHLPNDGDILKYVSSTGLWTKTAGSTTNITEGTNLYYTDARARAAISETVTGLDYNSSTGVLSTSLGYGIPTTASQTNWDAAYNDKINSAAVTGTTTKTLTLTQQDGGTITASWTDINTDAVSSVFGRTGAVVAVSGDYNTDLVTEGTTNLYFTNTRARGAISLTTTGSSGASTYVSGVLNVPNYTLAGLGGEPAITAGTTSQYWRGDKTFQTLNTAAVAESPSSLYFTNARSRSSISLTTTGTSGAATYNVDTGVLNIPQYSTDLSGYVTLGTAQTITGAKTFSNFLNVQYNNTGEPLVNARFGSNATNGIGGILVSGEYQSHIRFLTGSQTWDGAGAKQWQIRVGDGSGLDIFKIYSWTKGNDTMTILSNGNTTIHGTIAATNLSGTNTGDQTLSGLGGQPQLNGTGFVKASGTTISYDNTDYLPLTAGLSKKLTGDLYIQSNEPNIYLEKTGTDAGTWRILGSTGGTLRRFRIYDQEEGVDRFVVHKSTGNISIGNTSDGGYKLDVSGRGRYTFGGSNTLLLSGGARSLAFNIDGTATGDFGVALRADSSSYISISAGGGTTTGLAIDFKNNLGIRNAAHESWSSSAIVLQLGATATVYNDGFNNTLVANNSYYNGSNNIYLTTGFASRILMDKAAGIMYFQTAPSGTAAGTVTYTTAIQVNNDRSILLSNLSGTGTRMVVASSDGTLSTQAIPGGGSSQWTTNGTKIYYNTGNVGINVSDPTNLLHLAGSSATPSLRLGSVSNGFHWDIGRENQTTGDFVFNNANGGATSERARITLGGNIGLSCIPSAWNSAARIIQFDSTKYSSVGSIGTDLHMSLNAYFSDTGWKSVGDGQSANIGLYGGNINFRISNATFASANSTITWASPMQIANNGLITYEWNAQPPVKDGLYANQVLITNSSANYQRIRFDVGSQPYWGVTREGSTNNFIISGYIGTTWTDNNFKIFQSTGNLVLNGTGTDHGKRLQVFGDIGLGGQTYNWMVSNVSDTNWGFGMFNSGETYYPTVYFAATSANGNDRGFRVRNVSTSTNVLFVNSVGTLTASGDVVAFSDIRFKENIRPIENVLNRIGESRGVLYDRKDTGLKNNIGFIAQELELQFPELVNTDDDGIKSVKYSNAVAVLFEAIKEQQKQINELKNQKV
jgi:hypothetical protein